MKLKVGIVGIGRSGWHIHIKLICELPSQYQITAICDKNIQFLKEANAELNCKIFDDYDSFLDYGNFDLVIITTPTKLHYSMAKDAIRLGFNVVIDKPITTCLREVESLYAESRKSNSIMFPFYNFRFTEDFLLIKEILNSKKIGDIKVVRKHTNYFNRRQDWQCDKEENGGIINAVAIHGIDQVCCLSGSDIGIRFFSEKTMHHSSKANDYCRIILEDSNCLYDIEASWVNGIDDKSWLITGTQGEISIRDSEVLVKYFNNSSVTKEDVCARSYFPPEKINWFYDRKRISDNYITGHVSSFYQLVYTTIYSNSDSFIDEKSVLKTSMLVDKLNSFNLELSV